MISTCVAVCAALVVLAPSATQALDMDMDIQPALDLITRRFGATAASTFSLSILGDGDGCGELEAPCFSLSQTGGKINIAASAMAALTYGIGYYTRFTCGLTVGWKQGGGSYVNSTSWPCTQSLPAIDVARAVPYTYQDNVCTHSYSYVWFDEEEWQAHLDTMALTGMSTLSLAYTCAHRR
eukprot:SAG31_NODE_17034_length_686_cov_0.669506_1_plen_181_part_00